MGVFSCNSCMPLTTAYSRGSGSCFVGRTLRTCLHLSHSSSWYDSPSFHKDQILKHLGTHAFTFPPKFSVVEIPSLWYELSYPSLSYSSLVQSLLSNVDQLLCDEQSWWGLGMGRREEGGERRLPFLWLSQLTVMRGVDKHITRKQDKKR